MQQIRPFGIQKSQSALTDIFHRMSCGQRHPLAQLLTTPGGVRSKNAGTDRKLPRRSPASPFLMIQVCENGACAGGSSRRGWLGGGLPLSRGGPLQGLPSRQSAPCGRVRTDISPVRRTTVPPAGVRTVSPPSPSMLSATPSNISPSRLQRTRCPSTQEYAR